MSATAYPAPATQPFAVPWPASARRIAPAIDLPRLLRDAFLILALLLTNMAGTAGAALFFAVLVLMIFRSPEAAFKAIAICYLGLMLNKLFVPKSLVWTPARLILPYLALVRFMFDSGPLRQSLFGRASYIAFLFFVAVMAVCSIMSGWYVQIALLKLTNYLFFITMLFSGVAVLRARRSDVGEWFVSLILAATLVGVGSIVFGAGRNFRPAEGAIVMGFNGAFLHPNAHATYASLFVAFLATVWILSRYRRSWLTLPMMACWFAFMGWSGSRTAFVASLTSLLLLVAYARPLRNRLGWRMLPNLGRGSLVLVGVGFLACVLVWNVATGGSVLKSVVTFINKADATAALDTDKILSSRKSLVEFSVQNFRENPVFGIGFGVAKTEAFIRLATLFTAPSEKGFLPTAILEEGGLIGTAAFLVFFCTFVWQLIRERNVPGLVVFLTFVVTNLGEVTIFAPGGGGSFGWIAVGAAMVLGDRCWVPPRPWLQPAPPRVVTQS